MFREKYLKYKQKYLDLKNDMEGGKCTLFKRKQSSLYKDELTKTTKADFLKKLQKRLKVGRESAKNTLVEELKPLGNGDRKLIDPIKKRFDNELCLISKGKFFGTKCDENTAKLGFKIEELVNNEGKIGVQKDGEKKDCDNEQLYTPIKIDNEEELQKEILFNALKVVYEMIEFEKGDNDETNFKKIKDYIARTELKRIYEEQTDGVDGIDELKSNIDYKVSFTIEEGIEAINKVINQKKLNKTCEKEGSLLDTDTPSCSQENIDFVKGLLDGISESEKEYTKSKQSLDKVKKVYEKEDDKLDESPTAIGERITKEFQDKQKTLIGDNFELDENDIKKLEFGEDNKLPSDKLKELIKNKVNPSMTGGGADTELPEALTETPFM